MWQPQQSLVPERRRVALGLARRGLLHRRPLAVCKTAAAESALRPREGGATGAPLSMRLFCLYSLLLVERLISVTGLALVARKIVMKVKIAFILSC